MLYTPETLEAEFKTHVAEYRLSRVFDYLLVWHPRDEYIYALEQWCMREVHRDYAWRNRRTRLESLPRP